MITVDYQNCAYLADSFMERVHHILGELDKLTQEGKPADTKEVLDKVVNLSQHMDCALMLSSTTPDGVLSQSTH